MGIKDLFKPQNEKDWQNVLDVLDKTKDYKARVVDARIWVGTVKGKERKALLIRFAVDGIDGASGVFFNINALYTANMILACNEHLGFDTNATTKEDAINDFCNWIKDKEVIISYSQFGSERAKFRWGINAEKTKKAIEKGIINLDSKKAMDKKEESNEGKELFDGLTDAQKEVLAKYINMGIPNNKLIDLIVQQLGFDLPKATKLITYAEKVYKE